MTPAWLASNIVMYALQIGALIAAAVVVSLLLRVQAPGVRLFYWHMVLLFGLLLPCVRSSKQPAAGGIVEVAASVSSAAPRHTAARFPLSASELVLVALGAGIVVRAVLLGLGLLRLRRYRIHSRALSPVSSWSPEADIRVSSEVPGPVTFGYLRPVVLLPANFTTLEEPVQEAILCHEILHVRRRDWLFTVGEESVRAVFWFHPAVWWLLSEIQLAREQTVDREAVSITKGRDNYVDALLAIAGATHGFEVAPLFLRKRHLKRRVVSILKEIKMSKTKTFSALAAGMGMLAAAGWFIAGALPLRAAPQEQTAVSYAVSLRSLSITGFSEGQKAALLAKMEEAGIREGQKLPGTGFQAVQAIANTYSDPPFRVQFKVAVPDQVDISISALPASDPVQVRVGANVQEANILQKTPPVYPGLAKAARVQGTVKIEVIIAKDGTVKDLHFVSGPPLLIQSAMDAVRDWTWRPTLLNGEPTDVVTTVDVNFTLSP